MRRRKPPPRIRVEVVTDFTAEVRGTGDFRVLERLKVPAQFQYHPPSGGSPCWTVPVRYAADVEAMAERLGGVAVVDGQGSLL